MRPNTQSMQRNASISREPPPWIGSHRSHPTLISGCVGSSQKSVSMNQRLALDDDWYSTSEVLLISAANMPSPQRHQSLSKSPKIKVSRKQSLFFSC